jgi:DNA-binding MarR family transcriptional regulator
VTRSNAADRCAQTVMEIIPRVMHAIREEMRRQGAPSLSIPQLRTLAYLHRRPGSCLFPLAEHLGVTRPTASAIVERLVRRRLVNRSDDPRERRRVVLTLTPLGLRRFRLVRRSTQLRMAQALSKVSADRLRQIMHGVSLLGEPFKEASDGNHPPRERGSGSTAPRRSP